MTIKKIDDTILSGIADAIRAKTGGTAAMTPAEMSGQIEGIQSGGGGFDTSQITRTQNMFYQYAGESIDLTGLNTSNVTVMDYMFFYSRVISLDVSSFNTSKVTSMHGMFSNCNKLTSLDLSSFDTSNVTRMSEMFSQCMSLESLDLRNFNTSKVTSMSSIFYMCYNLKTLHIGADSDTEPQPLIQSNLFSGSSSNVKIYVPAHLVDAYKTATNWSQYADQIYAREA